MPWDELTHILSVTAYILRLFFGLCFLAHWRNVPLTTGINMSKNRDGILLVLTDRKDRDWTMLISDWTGYVKPLVRYEITVKKYAVRRQVLIFNQHICLPYKKSWQPENS